MEMSTTYAGMDAHARAIHVAVLAPGAGKPEEWQLTNEPKVFRLSTSSDFVSAREQRLRQCRRFRRRMPQRRSGVQVHRWPGCSC